MVRWLRWRCPLDTGFEIRTLAVWGRARYLSATEAPHTANFHTWMGKKHFFCFFQTAENGNRTPNSGVEGSGANHYSRAPAQLGLCISYSEIIYLRSPSYLYFALFCVTIRFFFNFHTLRAVFRCCDSQLQVCKLLNIYNYWIQVSPPWNISRYTYANDEIVNDFKKWIHVYFTLFAF